ncbi:MAG: hypothetical protein Q4G46_02535 [Propionibacteriaceae bacterium]|nr:hypothetical protein [Propionibacteriaceae bacterium]
MSAGLPAVDPAYAAEVLASLPPRLAKKMDAQDPTEWIVSEGTPVTVTVGKATVTINGPTDAACDCLLAPKCLHLAAVLAACPVADAEPPTDADAATDTGSTHEAATPTSRAGANTGPDRPRAGTSSHDDATDDVAVSRLPGEALEAVELAEQTLDTLITEGLAAITTPDRARVLRTVALARVHGLHRLGAAFATLHSRLSTPTTEGAVVALAECAVVVWGLAYAHNSGTITDDHLGTARRRYSPIGTLRLQGLACEPVVTDSGYSGVVTHLADDTGRVWTLNSIVPGDLAAIRGAYRGSTGLPEVTAPHRELARSGLLVTRATGSADGRLGKGSGVRASVRTSAGELANDIPGWWCGEAEITGLQAGPDALRLRLRTADGLKFAEFAAAVWQLDPDAVRLLGGCAGTTVEVRLRGGRLLAIRSSAWGDPAKRTDPDGDWWFPGLDRISRDALGTTYAGPPTIWPAPAGLDPVTVVTRWRDRVARQGRRTVTGAGLTGLTRDRAWLETVASPARARLLAGLAEAGARGERRFDGSFEADPTALRPAWTALAASLRSD